MGKLGLTHTGATNRTTKNAPGAYRHFDQPSSEEEAAVRRQITAGVIVGAICALAFVGWVLAFR